MPLTVCLFILAMFAFRESLAQTNHGGAKTNAAPAAQRVSTKPKPLPFQGKLTAVDRNARTLSVGKRVFHLTSETKLLKGSRPAPVEEFTVGQLVTGSYTKTPDGKLLAVRVYLGGKNAGSSKPQ
jgi:hypothetical protein